MPIALDPQETTWFPLAIDENKPDGERPEFECRFIEYATARRIRTAIEKAIKEKSDDKASEILDDAICSAVVGWRDMRRGDDDIEFSRDALSEVLTVTEKFELAGLCVMRTQLAEWDRKKSAWQSRSNAEASAENATDPQESA